MPGSRAGVYGGLPSQRHGGGSEAGLPSHGRAAGQGKPAVVHGFVAAAAAALHLPAEWWLPRCCWLGGGVDPFSMPCCSHGLCGSLVAFNCTQLKHIPQHWLPCCCWAQEEHREELKSLRAKETEDEGDRCACVPANEHLNIACWLTLLLLRSHSVAFTSLESSEHGTALLCMCLQRPHDHQGACCPSRCCSLLAGPE